MITINATKRLEILKQKKLLEIKALLAASDYKCLKLVDGSLSVSEYEPIKAQRIALRAAYNAVEVATTKEELDLIVW